jgi:phage shock protein PspC (stress-responsive transcriptional regulator)
MDRMSSIWTIRRSATDAKVAGLCGGLAQHWGIDPVLVRVGWVLLALSGGIGLVLYLAGWLLIPVDGSRKAPVEDLLGESVRRWPRELWITLVVITSLATFAVFGWLSPFGIGPAIVIAVIWYFGFYKGHQDKGFPAAPQAAADSESTDSTLEPAQPGTPEFVQHSGPPTPFTQAAEAWQRRVAEHSRHVVAPGQTSPPPAEEWPSPPPENLPQAASDSGAEDHAAFFAEPDPAGLYVEPPPSAPVKMSDTRSAKRLRLVAVIVLGLTLSGLGVAQALGLAIPLAGYLAAALLVIGFTLVAATWFGRARGLLPLGVLLAIAVAIVAAAGPAIRAPYDATSVRAYASLAELPARDSTEVGKLLVDLSRVAVTGDVTYAAHVDLGQLIVRVPEDANVVINYRADLGAVRAYGAEVRAGSELTGQVTDPQPVERGQHTLTLDLSVDAGNIEVQR